MGHFSDLNAFDVSDDLEMVAWDSYPTGFVQEMSPEEPTVDELRAGNPDQLGLNHDLYRSARDRPFWVMEQQPGDINWPAQGTQPADGAMRLWAHHASAHGADGIVYFRWQRCLEGQEQYHAGLRKQDGSPDRGYHDATQAADELAAIGGEDGVDHVDAPVASCSTTTVAGRSRSNPTHPISTTGNCSSRSTARFGHAACRSMSFHRLTTSRDTTPSSHPRSISSPMKSQPASRSTSKPAANSFSAREPA